VCGGEDLNAGTTGTVLASGPARHRTDDVYVEVLVLFARPTTSVCDRNRGVDADANGTELNAGAPSVVPMVSTYLLWSFSPS
jgi:hypothetical protein